MGEVLVVLVALLCGWQRSSGESEGVTHAEKDAGRVIRADTGQDITEGVQILYDIAHSSMDWGSGFLGGRVWGCWDVPEGHLVVLGELPGDGDHRRGVVGQIGDLPAHEHRKTNHSLHLLVVEYDREHIQIIPPEGGNDGSTE